MVIVRRKSSIRALIIKGATGKGVVIGVLITGLIRILLSAFRGKGITDTIGTSAVGIILVLLVYVLFHKVFQHMHGVEDKQ
jgi:hypothetical protein